MFHKNPTLKTTYHPIPNRAPSRTSLLDLALPDRRDSSPSSSSLTIKLKSAQPSSTYTTISSLPSSLSSSTPSISSSSSVFPTRIPSISSSLKSLLVLYFLTLVSEAARGLLLSSQWPYFRSLGGSKSSLGLLVSSYSLGRMLSVIPLGRLSDKLPVSSILICASLLQAFGHVLYAIASSSNTLLIARALVGAGSASTSIARAHVAKTSTDKTRTKALAYLSGVQFAGFALLPALGGIMTNWHEIPNGLIRLNGFSYPAWILVIANMLCAVLVIYYYTEPESDTTTPEQHTLTQVSISSNTTTTSSKKEENEKTEEEEEPLLKKSTSNATNKKGPDFTAMFVCLGLNLVFRGIAAQLESVAIPFMVEAYRISYASSSSCMTLLGVFGTILYSFFGPISSSFSDRLLTVAGLAITCTSAFALTVYKWNLGTYVLFLGGIWSVAYPLGQTAVLALFSRAFSEGDAGAYMGVLSASGALAPLVLSVIATTMWEKYGRNSVFCFMGCCATVAIAVVWRYYGRLGGLREKRQQHKQRIN